MRDQQGCYYYPNPAQKSTRMYVRERDGEIEFRLHSDNDPQIWERHKWLGLDVIRKATAMFDTSKGDPLELYDEAVAKAVLSEKA